MRVISGKYADAICYASVIEDKALAQIQQMLDTPFTAQTEIRIMPDVHAGAGCTIGTTISMRDDDNIKIVPNVVGVDIGCGMFTVKLAEKEIDLPRLDEVVHGIPSGMDAWPEPVRHWFNFKALRCYEHLYALDHLDRSMGTLGGGNHFVEVDRGSDGALYLVIHSGSRNLGKQVAEYYQRLAIDTMNGAEKQKKERKALIEKLKAEGRQQEIEAALKGLKFEKTVPDDLCWLEGKQAADYLADAFQCTLFARFNRETMAQKIMNGAGLHVAHYFHTVHNYLDKDTIPTLTIRKGAISAQAGENVLIPINMRDGSILGRGKGNRAWNYSAPHGAGRIMSRNAAKSKLTMEEYEAAMKGIYTTSVCPETIDEAPMAYKSMADILDTVKETVDVLDILKPVYNFKAAQ